MTLTAPHFTVGAAVQPLPISPLQIDGHVVRDARVRNIQADNRIGQHDQLKLQVIMPILNSSTLLNLPLYLRYGASPRYGYFYGYITNVSKPQKVGTASQLDITALGFSSVMKLSPSRMFQGMTTTQILTEVLRGSDEYPYKIGLAAQDHSFVHQRLAQVGCTDWEFVVKVAGMAGFYVYPYSGAVIMSNPIQTLEKNSPRIRLEKSAQTLDDKPLIDFVPAERTDQTRADFEPEFAYFTANGGLQKSIPKLPPQSRMKIPDYIYSQAYAEFISEGMKVMTGLYQTADARIRGDASVRPGDLVDVRTGSSQGALDSFDGLWYVNYTSTYVDEKVFQTGLKLCRDKYRRVRTGTSSKFYLNDPRRFPTMRLNSRAGVWQSSWSIR
jgi:hypothetical protein